MSKRLALAWLLLLLAVMIPSASATSYQKIQGYCQNGGTHDLIGGLLSAKYFMQNFPSCTITIYDHGTANLSTLYADNSGTPLANPFTASNTGLWGAYAADGRYDIQESSGGISSPFTLSDFLLNSGSTTVDVVTYAATPIFPTGGVNTIFVMTLTGNVSSSTITGSTTGQQVIFNLCQDGTGGRTFVWPVSFLRPPILPSGASQCANTVFFYDGTNWKQSAATGDVLVTRNIEQIRYADQFPGGSVTAKIDAALADIPSKGVVIIPSTMGAGSATAIASGKVLLDFRAPDVNAAFQIFTNYSTSLPAFALTDAGVNYQIRAAAVSQNPQIFGITGEPFERAIVQMDGTASGRGSSLQFLFGPGTDDRYLDVSPGLVNAYSTGTMDVVNNSTAVVGHGTAWTSDMIGQAFVTDGQPTNIMKIAAVPSATSITLNTAWPGTGISGGTYSIQSPVWNSSSGFRMSSNNRFLWGQTSLGTQIKLIGLDNQATNHYLIANGTINVNSVNGYVGFNGGNPVASLDIQGTDNTNGMLIRRTGGNVAINAFMDAAGAGGLNVDDNTGTPQVSLKGAGASTFGSAGISINGGTAITGQSGTGGTVAMTVSPVLTTATHTGLTNGTGLQFLNTATTCTTGASIGATCTTAAITLPVAYADTNYRAVCVGLTPTNVPIVETVAKSNTTFTITIAALTAAAATFASFDCHVGHN